MRSQAMYWKMTDNQKQSKSDIKKQRAALFRDVTSFKKTVRIPNLGNIGTWRVLDAGYKLSEAFNDYQIMEKCITRFLDIYPVDTLVDFGLRNPFKLIETFGQGSYYYNDQSGIVAMRPMELCSHEELKEIIEDPQKFFWEKALPRKYSNLSDKTLLDWQQVYDEDISKNKYSDHIHKLMQDTYYLPLIAPPRTNPPIVGIEMLFSVLRGIKGFSYDIKKDPVLVKTCIEKLNETTWNPVIKSLNMETSCPDIDYCFDASLMLLAQSVISPKQFEYLYFPYIKQMIELLISKNKNIRIVMEGNSLPFFDFFAEYPKGTVALNTENDDLVNIRRKYPQIALIGGMKTTTLALCSKEECIYYARRLIDDLGEGYIFSTDKFVFYAQDAKAENLKEVFRFVRNYNL